MYTNGITQNNKFSAKLRVPVQIEFQKEDVDVAFNSPNYTKATAINYGIDVLAEKQLAKKINAYIGVGYFRNRFNIRRFYDHQQLNTGIDSIPISTYALNYIYHLIRFPLGTTYNIGAVRKTMCKIGGEFIFNYSFKRTYNGGTPFPNANNKISEFKYSGNSIILFTCFVIPVNNQKTFELEPYIRIYNSHKKDEILFENPSQTISHIFDAFGISFKYSLTKNTIK